MTKPPTVSETPKEPKFPRNADIDWMLHDNEPMIKWSMTMPKLYSFAALVYEMYTHFHPKEQWETFKNLRIRGWRNHYGVFVLDGNNLIEISSTDALNRYCRDYVMKGNPRLRIEIVTDSDFSLRNAALASIMRLGTVHEANNQPIQIIDAQAPPVQVKGAKTEQVCRPLHDQLRRQSASQEAPRTQTHESVRPWYFDIMDEQETRAPFLPFNQTASRPHAELQNGQTDSQEVARDLESVPWTIEDEPMDMDESSASDVQSLGLSASPALTHVSPSTSPETLPSSPNSDTKDDYGERHGVMWCPIAECDGRLTYIGNDKKYLRCSKWHKTECKGQMSVQGGAIQIRDLEPLGACMNGRCGGLRKVLVHFVPGCKPASIPNNRHGGCLICNRKLNNYIKQLNTV